MSQETKSLQNHSVSLSSAKPKLRYLIKVLKKRLIEVPNNSSLALHNTRFSYYTKKAVGPGTYDWTLEQRQGYKFNNIPRFHSNLAHSILSNSYIAYKNLKKVAKPVFQTKNKIQAVQFKTFCQENREKNRKHIQKIETNLKTRQETRKLSPLHNKIIK
jgi:hypothetical protein